VTVSVAAFVVVVLLTVRGLVSRRARYLRWAMYTSIGSLVAHDVRRPDGTRVDVPSLLGPGDVWVTDLTVSRALARVPGPVAGSFVIRYGFQDVEYGVGPDA
jgi:hypothetical protein